ncbi:MAG: bifunctional ADP-dependent NAD(P)H-hydrate dehydratase/NAD(P)H-hydrate epimerase [Wenzhouxiangellaceae bacterium]
MSIANTALYTAGQVRRLDRLAIERFGIADSELMERAGRAAFRQMRVSWPEARRVLVCCGSGNNGGDGYVIARLCAEAGLTVRVLATRPPEALSGAARVAAERWSGSVCSEADPADFDVVVDALLGSGLARELDGPIAALVGRLNEVTRQGSPGVLAVDVPTGLNADTGMPMGNAVRADLTVTFIARKRGLYTGHAAEFRGHLVYRDLQVPAAVFDELAPDARLLDASALAACLQPRPAAAHKGRFGRVLVIGGDYGYPGACVLSARAALVGGAGLVSVATRERHAWALAAALPEAMWADAEAPGMLDTLFDQATVLAVGPGLGRSTWSQRLFERAIADPRPMVLDADGLNLLADRPIARGNWVLTPHPGEAGRLLGVSTAQVQRDRFASARELASRYAATVVLKGAGTVVASPEGAASVCAHGTPAMAGAGMGDALTGLVAALIAQGFGLHEAAELGVLVHALAGERAAAGRRCILAGELIDTIGPVMGR